MKINIDNLINLNYIIKHRRGHPPNLCLQNPNASHKIIMIPKNASTWFKSNLVEQGWQSRDYTHCQGRNLVVLRDPLQRWFSGVVQFLARNHPKIQHNNLTEDFVKLIFGQVDLDEHTQSQFLFFHQADLESTDFLWLDESFTKKVTLWLETAGFKLQHPSPIYTTEQDHYRQLLKNKIVEIYNNNQQLQQRLQDYFDPEYEMIKTYDFKK